MVTFFMRTALLLCVWVGVAEAGSKELRKAVKASGPSASAAEIPALSNLLDKAGWEPTPELSGVFRTGSIFEDTGHGHTLMVRECFDGPVGIDTYTSAEVVSQLQAGVKVRVGLGSAKASGELVKKVKFGTPVHHTLERLGMEPTTTCRELLGRATPETLDRMYAVQEVLTAEIAEQTCGRIDASGRFIGLGEAEAELSRACVQESLEPVAVAYRVVPIRDLGIDGSEWVRAPAVDEDCDWGPVKSVHTTMTKLTVNGETLDVRGADQRAAIASKMQRCGHLEAAEAFEAWRAMRRTTNVSCATLVGCYPFAIGIYSARRAKKKRATMEKELLQPSGTGG